MRQLRLCLVLLVVLLSAVACSSARAGGAGTNATAYNLEVVFGTNPTPAKMGQVELYVDVYDLQRQPVDDARVTFTAGMEGHSMGSLSGPGTTQGNGRHATRANLSMAGEWVVQVQVQTSEHNVQREFKVAVQ